ncbi:hypothetical protein SAMN05216517_101297 [Janthinobacterium sp. OK676]|uniref:hypothetical protein n=1 Tax=unclassified Janthinobacterium TaxID=2610881 RepID=UPI000881B76A|nr:MULTISPECIES: hypothetical protein [unclassified Janthinobacterium]PJJ17960.1 hypothetical protein CLU90_1141 [Janthinobacterium sp. 67]SDL49587.1 hypothetical protein SAMN05216517_101297 [Janthinobacterium sp. OK676]
MHKQFPAARMLAATFAAALMQPAVAAETAELAPVDVANLYIKTIINQDEASVAKLNAYLRPTRLAGQQSAEYASYSGLKEADAKFPTQTGKLIADLFPAAMRAAVTPAAEQLAANVIAAKNGAACQATKAAPVTVENGIQTAAVSFECQVVKVPVTWATAAQQLAKSGCKLEQCKAGLEKIAATYTSSPKQAWRAVFAVSREKNSEAWRNDFARETFDEIWEYL